MQGISAKRGVPVAASPVKLSCSLKGRAFVPMIEAKLKTRREKIADTHRRIRNKVSGTSERPRLAVFKSNNHVYAQVIDDTTQRTLVAANTMQADVKEAAAGKTSAVDGATAVGKKIAELCKAQNIEKVAFDRGGFIYTGRVAAVADAAREGGLQF